MSNLLCFAEGIIQTSDAMIQPEIMALQNISPGVLAIISWESETKAARVALSNTGR